MRPGTTVTRASTAASAAVVLWVVAPLISFPDFDRDSIRLPLMLTAAIFLIGAAVIRGLRGGELLLRREPTLALAGVGWAVTAVSFLANGADPDAIPLLGMGLAGICAYAVISRGLVGRAAAAGVGYWTLAGVGALSSVYVLIQAAGTDPIGWGLFARDVVLLIMCGAVYAATLPVKKNTPSPHDEHTPST